MDCCNVFARLLVRPGALLEWAVLFPDALVILGEDGCVSVALDVLLLPDQAQDLSLQQSSKATAGSEVTASTFQQNERIFFSLYMNTYLGSVSFLIKPKWLIRIGNYYLREIEIRVYIVQNISGLNFCHKYAAINDVRLNSFWNFKYKWNCLRPTARLN